MNIYKVFTPPNTAFAKYQLLHFFEGYFLVPQICTKKELCWQAVCIRIEEPLPSFIPPCFFPSASPQEVDAVGG